VGAFYCPYIPLDMPIIRTFLFPLPHWRGNGSFHTKKIELGTVHDKCLVEPTAECDVFQLVSLPKDFTFKPVFNTVHLTIPIGNGKIKKICHGSDEFKDELKKRL